MISDNYSIEHTQTEIAAGGALLYINKRLYYHPRNDLNIYMPGKLESIFTQTVFSKVIKHHGWMYLQTSISTDE